MAEQTNPKSAAKPKPKKKPAKKQVAKKPVQENQPAALPAPAPRVVNIRPLPPPVEVLTVTEAFPPQSNQDSEVPLPSFLNSDEPKPGEPLNEEQERILSGEAAADRDRAQPGEVISAEDAEAQEAAALLSEMAGFIEFSENDVRGVLEDGFAWLGKKFDSDHWNLSERQANMLARPTTQLLSTAWTKLAAKLPDLLLRACTSTPGLAGTVLAGAIVIGPKAVQQIMISKTRRVRNAGQVTQEPIDISQQRQAGPVGSVQPRSSSPLQ